MQFIKIKNWEKFQHYKDRSPPWIKLYNELLDDYEWSCLQDASKLLQIHLWMLYSRVDKLPFDYNWLKQKIPIKFSNYNLNELKTKGFIDCYQDASNPLADCKQSAIPEKRQRRDREEGEADSKPRVKRSAQLTDNEFIESLKSNPAYKGVDVDCELGKMDAWLSTRPGRKKTRKFVVNWLNKIDKPMGVVNEKPKSAVAEYFAELRAKESVDADIGEGSADIRGCLPAPKTDA